MKLKLRGKLTVPTFTVIIICLSCSGWFSYRTARNSLQDALAGQMKISVDAIANGIDSYLSDLALTFKNLSGQQEITRLLSPQDSLSPQIADQGSRLLQQTLNDYPGQFEFLAVTDRQGQTLAASDSSLPGSLNVRDRQYFQNCLAGQAATELVTSKVSGEPVLILAYPVTVQGEVVGTCLGAIRLAYLAGRFVTPVHIAKNGYAYLTDKDGRFLAHPDRNLIFQQSIAGYDWGQRMLRQKRGFQIYRWKDQEKVVAYRPIDSTGWVIAAGANFNDIFAPIASIRWTNISWMLITLAGVGIVLFWMAQSVSETLKRGVRFAADIKAGDLSKRLNMQRHDELADLAHALDRMADGLEQKAQLAGRIAGGDLTGQVNLASDRDRLGQSLAEMSTNLQELIAQLQTAGQQIAGGSVQVADSSQSLSQGATEAAASLQEITASMTLVTSQTRQNADHAGQADALSQKARDLARQGNDKMADLICAMDEINNSSDKISGIIKIIDGLAFQTNLLALNAAVEAARAGQHGKGFAVVAEEVRHLAARSAQAAEETASLIRESSDKTRHGSEIVGQIATALQTIFNEANQVSTLVAEIAAASIEQSSALDQVSHGLSQIESVVQQTTANAEESAAAAEQLSGQSEELRQVLFRFKVNTLEPTDSATEELEGDQLDALPGSSEETHSSPFSDADFA